MAVSGIAYLLRIESAMAVSGIAYLVRIKSAIATARRISEAAPTISRFRRATSATLSANSHLRLNKANDTKSFSSNR